MDIAIQQKPLDDIITNRLGTCENCGANEAKYTCPRCEYRSCCLQCVKSHKKEFDCNGIRDKTRFKSVSQFTDLDLLSDYRLLEEAGRSIENYYRDVSKKHSRMNKELPTHLHRLRCAAAQRGITLRFLPSNFTRHKFNTTYLNWKTRKIDWKIEWKFVSWNNISVVDSRVFEGELLQTVFQNTLKTNTKELSLEESELKELHFYLAAEHTPGQNGRFHPISLEKTLSDNLKGTIIVEHPIFHVVIDPQDRYPLVGSPLKVSESTRPKVKKNISNTGDNQADDPVEKKAKLTFFDVSDGELSE